VEGDKSTMLFDDVLKNPLLKKAIAAGEEHAGRVVGKLLSSDRVATGLQGLLAAASTARATMEAALHGALKAAKVPDAEEVQALRQKIEELEVLMASLSARLDATPSAAPPAPTGPARSGSRDEGEGEDAAP
jgi:hypothetical protein